MAGGDPGPVRPGAERERAARLADKYISADGQNPTAMPRPPVPTILEQIIADTELLAIHGADLDECEACDVWLTMEEAVRCSEGPTLCPHQAYGGPKYPAEPCYRDRPWRHAHRHGFDQAEAVRRIAELMDAEHRGRPTQFHGGVGPSCALARGGAGREGERDGE